MEFIQKKTSEKNLYYSSDMVMCMNSLPYEYNVLIFELVQTRKDFIRWKHCWVCETGNHMAWWELIFLFIKSSCYRFYNQICLVTHHKWYPHLTHVLISLCLFDQSRRVKKTKREEYLPYIGAFACCKLSLVS